MDERAAINLLRLLISHKGGILESGRADPGWCCEEHSVVSCFAFALTGKRMLHCQGDLLIFKEETREILNIEPHFFLIDDSCKVFDSSVSFEDLEGLPTNAMELMPNIMVLAGPDRLPKSQLLQKLCESVYDRAFSYTAESPVEFWSKAIEWESKNEFGVELGERFGGQKGLWTKTAWFVSEAMKGCLPDIGEDKDSAWDAIAASPCRDEEVTKALIGVSKKT